MAQSQDLKKIKKTYGEKFMKMCRSLFPTIENEGKLYEILQTAFSDNTKTLYEDIQRNNLEDKFASYIYDMYEQESEERVVTDKTPYELLEEAGYELTECMSEKEIESFKKYYAHGEELCTFHGDRLEDCVVFWAVKKNVDEIKRKNFKNPERDDEYGTSVMSIQFLKNVRCRVSIKNRYNHTVDNPDATLDNDLEKIAPGLTYSFEKLLRERGLELDSSEEKFKIPGYIKANDGKYYKFNAQIGTTYYCPDNIVIEAGEPRKFDGQEKQFLIDYFVLDTEKKTLQMFDERQKDSFTDSFTDIQKMEITKDKEAGDGRKHITVYKEGQEEPVVITIDKDNRIIGYKNSELKEVGDGFLSHNIGLETLETPKLEKAGKDFCYYTALEELNLPSLKSVGHNFCRNSECLKKVNVPELTEVKDRGLSRAIDLEELNAPKLEKVGDNFCSNTRLSEINLPNLMEVGNSFSAYCGYLKQINMPKIEKIGNEFCLNTRLSEINLPNLMEVGNSFCANFSSLKQINMPKIEKVGNDFCSGASEITSVSMQSLTKAGEYFLENATELTEFNAPKISRLQWFFSPNRHMVPRISKIKKEQRIKGKDIVDLDKETELFPQEVEEAEHVVEGNQVERIKENVIENNENII